jgi:F5/8 type C domain
MVEINAADKIVLGGAQASAVYLGSTKVWPLFTPKKISGCVIWLDASRIYLADGAAVNTWTNLGSGPQPTITNTPAPTFRKFALNGLPVVRITKEQGCLRITGTGITKDWTTIYVARRWRNTPGRVVTAMAGTNQNILVGFWDQYMDVAFNEGWTSGDPISGGSATTWKLYSADNTTAAATPRLFSNGVLIGTFPTPPSTATWAGTFNISGSGPTEYADCEIAEVVQYNRKLSDAERQQVEGYLRTKWSPPPFQLTDLGANLVGWFDGADASKVQITGSGVNQWINKGVGALTLIQSNDAYRPTYANQTVTIPNSKSFVAASAPSSFDIVWLGKPRLPVDGNDWRTLLRGTTSSHHIILENISLRLGTYNAGYFAAVSAKVSPSNMTSDTAPSPYVVSQSETYAGYPAYLSFDGNILSHSHSAVPVLTRPYWIKIDLGSSRFVSQYNYQARDTSGGGTVPYQQWKSWTFEGSNDNSTWTLVDTVSNVPDFTLSEKRTYPLDVPSSFRYWRWTVTLATGFSEPYAASAELELHEGLTWGNVWGIGAGSFGASPVTLSRDGGAMTNTNTTLTPADVPFISFGAYQSTPPSQGWGDLKEVVLLSYNSMAIRTVEGYLAHKWGYASLLPANHLYKSTPP